MKQVVYVLFLMFVCMPSHAQDSVANKYAWPASCDIRFQSSADGTLQPAYFLRAKSKEPRPLLIRLHAWSAHYTKYQMDDSYVQYCLTHDFYYLQPDFRGPNDHPEACGSPLVTADIDDAIDYAIAHGNIDTTQIHIIGGSGGGYTSMLCYMRLRHNVKTFTAFSSIANLVDYYYQCSGRREEYGNYMAMLEKSTSGLPREGFTPYFDEAEAMRRSPVSMLTPVEKRKGSKLFILHGIHDGCLQGDVPFTHSTQFFNKVVADHDYVAATRIAFTPEELLRMMDWQTVGDAEEKQPNQVLVERQYLDKVRIQILEAGHGAPIEKAIAGVESQNVVLLGLDDDQTIRQLKSACFSDFIYAVKGDAGEDETVRQGVKMAEETLRGMHRVVIVVNAGDAVSKEHLNKLAGQLTSCLQHLKDNPVFVKHHPRIDVLLVEPSKDGTDKAVSSFVTRVEKTVRGAEGHLSTLARPHYVMAENKNTTTRSMCDNTLVEALKQVITTNRVRK